MSRFRTGLLIILLTVLHTSLSSQNNTNSPYTRYGYGQLADQAFAGQRGMGGIGYGLRDSKLINPLNPASYSSVDSLTFMLDLGVTAQFGWFTDGSNKSRKFNGNLEYVAMQFPLAKRLGMGIGFEPISHVGYAYESVATTADPTKRTFSGSGGLSKIYGAISYDLLDRLSIGANVGYMFGDVKHERLAQPVDASAYSIGVDDTLRLNGLTFGVGLQYVQPLGKNERLVFGVTYTPKLGTSEKLIIAETRYTTNAYGNLVTVDTEREEIKSLEFEMPESFGVGFTYNKLNKLTVGADFLMQKWADAKFYGKTDTLKNLTKVSLGGEFIPDARSRSYFSRARYRAGGYYSNSYISVQGSGYKEYGASIGVGLPMNDNRSLLNVTFQYVAIRPEVKTLIDEQYFKLTISYTFNEQWFHKRKVQ